MTYQDLCKYLYDIKSIQFGDFKLKSGQKSPIYLDMRMIPSSPSLLKEFSSLISKKIPKNITRVCGVPYAAIPLATVVSMDNNLPLLIKRKEVKGYGTKKIIEGQYNIGDSILLLEDVITTGESLIETIIELENCGLKIGKIITLVDRKGGGMDKLKSKGYDIESLLNIDEILDLLFSDNLITKQQVDLVNDYLSSDNLKSEISFPQLSYHQTGQRLIDIAWKKRSNLIASIDLTTTGEILEFVNKVGEFICGIKIHVDIIKDFTMEFILKLKELSKVKEFIIIEDRKFADIGNTQLLQISGGVFNISSWADLITLHLISGEESLKAYRDWEVDNKPGLIAILEMSSKNSLTTKEYRELCSQFMYKYQDIVGVVSQGFNPENGLLKFTPGISIDRKTDNKGQMYNNPIRAIEELGSNFLIIGRDLYQSDDVLKVIKEYLKLIRMTNLFKIDKITNDYEYKICLRRLEEIFDSEYGSSEGIEANLLGDLIVDWENRNYPF